MTRRTTTSSLLLLWVSVFLFVDSFVSLFRRALSSSFCKQRETPERGEEFSATLVSQPPPSLLFYSQSDCVLPLELRRDADVAPSLSSSPQTNKRQAPFYNQLFIKRKFPVEKKKKR